MDEARAFAERIIAAAPLAVEAVKAIAVATEELSVEDGYAALRSGAARVRALELIRGRRGGPPCLRRGRDPEWKGE